MAKQLEGDYEAVLRRDGFAMIENFLTDEECDELLTDMWACVDEFDAEAFNKSKGAGVYDPFHKNDDDYLFESANVPKYFLESGSVDPKTLQLRVDKKFSINKVGHCVHRVRPIMKKFTFSDKTAVSLQL